MSSPASLRRLNTWFKLSPLMSALLFIAAEGYARPAITHSPAAARPQQALELYRFHLDHVLGTSFDLTLLSPNAADAQSAVEVALAEINRLEQILSIWLADSEINQLQQSADHYASADLFAVIAACETWRIGSCGAFDARLGQLLALWQQQHAIQSIDRTAHAQALQQLQQSSIVLQPQERRIQLHGDFGLAPDGYAKGYVIDRVLAKIRQAQPSIAGVLIDIGGDIRVWGQSPQAGGWTIGVQNPRQTADNHVPDQILRLDDQAIAFSGYGARDAAGLAHRIDPTTGWPLQQPVQCVVVGTCAADADALATALATMSAEQGLALIESMLGYHAQVIAADGQAWQSAGWQSLVYQDQRASLQPVNNRAQSPSTWPAGYQADLQITIPKIQANPYRPPYVAIWVTDHNHSLVRTLAIWGAVSKWSNSNYVWWRRYGSKMLQLDAVAKPTRLPGQYHIVWDGKDDLGKSVSAGKYIIHIEITREFGAHSYQTLDLDVLAKDTQKSLPAQAEIGQILLKFQRAI
jgi:thiamine biosynthesis lipoprotein